MQREPRDVTCKVHNCRFKFSHTTIGHKCGDCGDYGHGVMECNSMDRKHNLIQFHHDRFSNNANFCTMTNCSNENTHTTRGHICPNCNVRNHDISECIITHDIDIIGTRFPNIENLLVNYDNIYTIIPAGMGCSYYIRKKNNILSCLFMHSDSWGQYGPQTDDQPILNTFIIDLEEIYNPMEDSDSVHATPRCSHSHAMELSSYAGRGYTRGYICDGCHGNSASGHNNGSRERWFCPRCQEDLCFVCHPEPGAWSDRRRPSIEIEYDNVGDGGDIAYDNDGDRNNNNVVNDGGDSGDGNSEHDVIIANLIPNMVENNGTNTIKCPLCRTENNKTEILNIKGSGESCSVCYDNNVDKYFSKCEHACVCNSCYKKL